MILCLDIGNSHIFGGIYTEDKLRLQFRYPSSNPCTSDQLGVFFKSVLRENGLNPDAIKKVAICSVVPALNYSIRSAFLKYFSQDPFFLQVDNAKLKIGYKNPQEIGADRLANAVGAIHKFPNKNLIVVDLGTATTFDSIDAQGTYLSGMIIPGMYISMKSLYENTAKLSSVNIIKPQSVIGETTTANIQAGLYYSHLGAAKEIIARVTEATFRGEKPHIIGTGGFASLFEDENIFNAIVPELVLHGLHLAAK